MIVFAFIGWFFVAIVVVLVLALVGVMHLLAKVAGKDPGPPEP